MPQAHLVWLASQVPQEQQVPRVPAQLVPLVPAVVPQDPQAKVVPQVQPDLGSQVQLVQTA